MKARSFFPLVFIWFNGGHLVFVKDGGWHLTKANEHRIDYYDNFSGRCWMT